MGVTRNAPKKSEVEDGLRAELHVSRSTLVCLQIFKGHGVMIAWWPCVSTPEAEVSIPAPRSDGRVCPCPALTQAIGVLGI